MQLELWIMLFYESERGLDIVYYKAYTTAANLTPIISLLLGIHASNIDYIILIIWARITYTVEFLAF